MPPFAGQGMNSGIRDAQILAWKVAAVARGEHGPALLSTYETERREHAAAMIELAIRMGHVMMPRTPARAFALQTFFRLLGLYPSARSYFAEMKYKPKPRFHQGFLVGSNTSDRRTLIGALFPQALVATANGYQLLDDVLGDGFSIIAPPGTPIELLQKASHSELSKMALRFVAVLDKEDAAAAVAPVTAVRDARGEVATLLSPYPPGLYLVRDRTGTLPASSRRSGQAPSSEPSRHFAPPHGSNRQFRSLACAIKKSHRRQGGRDFEPIRASHIAPVALWRPALTCTGSTFKSAPLPSRGRSSVG